MFAFIELETAQRFNILVGGKMVWTGPEDNDSTSSLFGSLFAQTCSTIGDVFFAADLPTVTAFYRDLMQPRGSYLHASSMSVIKQLDWSSFLSPSGVQRLERYREQWDGKSTFLVEAAQNPEAMWGESQRASEQKMGTV